MPTSGGALALATLQPAADAFQVRKLRDAGAVILGKTTMHELAVGDHQHLVADQPDAQSVRSRSRRPGGSSGGTGAAIGASFAAAGMGSDTCGSIRIPAANQNLVGLARHARAVEPHRHHAAVVDAGHRRPARAHASPISRSCSTPRSAPTPPMPITKDGAGHIPKSYRDGLVDGGLKGARIGVLRSLLGHRAGRRRSHRHHEQGAGRHEGARRRSRRHRRARPRRSAARQQRDRRRVQVRPDGVPREASRTRR